MLEFQVWEIEKDHHAWMFPNNSFGCLKTTVSTVSDIGDGWFRCLQMFTDEKSLRMSASAENKWKLFPNVSFGWNQMKNVYRCQLWLKTNKMPRIRCSRVRRERVEREWGEWRIRGKNGLKWNKIDWKVLKV